MNVLIVGAGIVGVSIADALAARGIRVSVLEMRSPGRGASHASAGILAPYTEAHHDSPLLPLAVRSLDLFDAWVSGITARSGRAIEYARSGTLEIALDDDDLTRLQAASRWLTDVGIQHEWLDGPGVRTFEPAATDSSLGGLLVPSHGFVGVMSLLNALTHSARLSGATFEMPVEAVDVEAHPDRVTVRAGERRYDADAVIVAAGSWSSQVRVKGAPVVPVRPVRGQLLHLRWPQTGPLPARVVWGPRCYTVPWQDGSLLVGATVEEAGFDERSTVDGIRTLTGAAAELLPASRQASIEQIRVGLRPATADGLPVIGPFRTHPRITMATGHYRNGILLAPLTAEIVARWVVDGVEDRVFSATTPNRFTP